MSVKRSVLKTVLMLDVGKTVAGIFCRRSLRLNLFWMILGSIFDFCGQIFDGRRDLFLLHSSVLEPDLDLTFRKSQNFGQCNSTWSANVPERRKENYLWLNNKCDRKMKQNREIKKFFRISVWLWKDGLTC